VPKGHDKPYKYPLIFTNSQVVIISKIDYLPNSDFDVNNFRELVSGVNPQVKILALSARNGQGLNEWVQ
jgi:hydrogenase nickel incorporation protein HypB